jgi:alpha-beta hydrolase superfamily lysophospholipase
VRDNANIARAKSLLPDFAVVTVEKYGVKPGDSPADPYEGCSPIFYANHTVSQRAADYQQVLGLVSREPWWNGQLVLFGGSEGGAAISVLAPRVKPDAVVVFSTAPGRNFRETFKLAIPPPVAAQADAVFAMALADPKSTTVWGGNSYRWWADILDRDLVADLMAAEVPVLLVQGERDQSAPVAVARKARDAFAAEGRCELTYWELPGYDHQMRDASGASRLDEVLARISGWLRSTLAGERAAGCA